MKVHYTKILLFFFALNILLTLYQVHNKNKPYITPYHIPIYISRVLSECEIQSSNYDKDADMESVKEIFERETSQRFEEYDERMKEKRQKRKEERDTNVQKIIEKDEMEKSLAQKIEKGCLRCGCGLGGVAASVGLFGGLGTYGWKIAALGTAEKAAIAEGLVFGEAARIPAAVDAVISGLKSTFKVQNIANQTLVSYITPNTYTNASKIAEAVHMEYENLSCLSTLFRTGSSAGSDISFCSTVTNLRYVPGYVSGNTSSIKVIIESHVKKILADAQVFAEATKTQVTSTTTAEITTKKIGVIDAISSSCQTAIIASVVAILVIVLVMIIIYLVLRYRRKKKMNKKAQYTKLLKE